MLFRSASLAAHAVSLTACATVNTTQPETYSFGLWGDIPCKRAGDNPKLPAVLQSINRSDIAFSLCDGDIKDGSSRCTDDLYTAALTMFASMVKPVVYIPGDNEWTDCHRLNRGGMDALERLAHLRRVMFPSSSSLGQTQMPLEQQGKPGQKFVENIRFARGNEVFVGLDVPGSNNNLERDAANVAWLAESFAQATARDARGLTLVFQGDPGFDLPKTQDLDESTAPSGLGYRNFMKALVEQTEKFNGQVPLLHGDRTD